MFWRSSALARRYAWWHAGDAKTIDRRESKFETLDRIRIRSSTGNFSRGHLSFDKFSYLIIQIIQQKTHHDDQTNSRVLYLAVLRGKEKKENSTL